MRYRSKPYTYSNGTKRHAKRVKSYYKYQHRKKETSSEYLRRIGIEEHKEVKRITRLLIAKHGAVCAICGKEIRNKKELTLDHIRPKSKGGATVLENCQLACRECNERKGNKY